MRRRDFIKIIGGLAASRPLAANAQQPAMPVIGFLNGGSPAGYAPMVAAVREGLKQVGYVEGQNLTIEFRWAEGKYDRLKAMAAELVRDQVVVIAAIPPPRPRSSPRRQFQLCLRPAPTRPSSALSQASTGRAATSPE
jgi:putative ABC transport system substrate-binding protein